MRRLARWVVAGLDLLGMCLVRHAPAFRTLRRRMGVWEFGMCLLLCLSTSGQAETNSAATNRAAISESQRAEHIRAACIEGRRYVCGKVLQIVPDGLVVDSGYGDLLNPPLNRSWVVRGTASITRAPHAIEEKRPDAICVGLVFLTGIPNKPTVNEYDYVVLHAYPAGEYNYHPVAGVEKKIRRFCGSLERAITLNLQSRSNSGENKGKHTSK